MKIGILTFHYAHNFGAVLQAFALKTFLEEQGNIVEIINYRNKNVERNYEPKLRLEYFYQYGFSKKKPIHYIKPYLNLKNANVSWQIKCKKFEEFINDYLLSNKHIFYTKKDIEKLDYDLFISGSDQLWNKNITNGFDDVYFLKFETSAKKAFYAISDGNYCVTDENYIYYEDSLKNIDFISTRERTLAEDINLKFNKNALQTIDPSFLLDKEKYISVFNLKKTSGVLFAYFMGEDPILAELVGVISRSLNLSVIESHCYKTKSLKNDYQLADLGPLDFLNYIYSADFILTNSFHGTAFSIIFNKQFYSVYNEDSRKDNLLSLFHLENRHIKNPTEMDLNETIDYNEIDIDYIIKDSKDYLLSLTE